MHIKLFLFITIIMFSTQCSTKDDLLPETMDSLDTTPLKSIRISYGNDALQFGDLRLPNKEGLVPVIMIIHGGCWLSQYDLTLMDSMAIDLTKSGYATWNVEYRRTEDNGGGWPGTFLDVSYALKYLTDIAKDYPIDINQAYLTGHSAGGHLALWLGTQIQLDINSILKVDNLPEIQGIVSLAGITDLSTYYKPSGCGSNVKNLINGLPEELPQRYTEGSPISYLPLGVPQILLNGTKDNIVSIEHITPYFDLAKIREDSIKLVEIPNAGHFELITPGSIAWDTVLESFSELIEN